MCIRDSLEAYLNEVYFGQRCSGVMTAARVYFGKDVSELTLAECASMMGITNNPSMYDPFISSWTRENNRERQLTILSEMLSQGKICLLYTSSSTALRYASISATFGAQKPMP